MACDPTIRSSSSRRPHGLPNGGNGRPDRTGTRSRFAAHIVLDLPGSSTSGYPVRMSAWRIPDREEILPVSTAQSCAICGTNDWSWLILLLNAPDWVQQRGWFANWFIALCDDCHEPWEQGRDDVLRSRWNTNEEHALQHGGPGFDEYREVVVAMQSEPAVERSVATAQRQPD